MKEKFTNQQFTERSLATIKQVDDIIKRYQAQGYNLTVRQIHYQFVSLNFYANTQANYSNLASLVSNARMAGLLDWDAIQDRGRITHERDTWNSVKDYVAALTNHYRYDKWKDQPNYVELMVEKQALEGVLLPICEKFEIPFTSNKGYGSTSLLYERGKVMHTKRGIYDKEIHIIYLGDHDPSGLDMSRDIESRLVLFSQGPVKVHRVALNWDQTQELNLPENPAKQTDSRSTAYIEQFGESSFELDAIRPDLMAEMVRNTIDQLLDHAAWRKSTDQEDKDKDKLQDIVEAL